MYIYTYIYVYDCGADAGATNLQVFYICLYIHVSLSLYIYIYIYIERERERERERDRALGHLRKVRASKLPHSTYLLMSIELCHLTLSYVADGLYITSTRAPIDSPCEGAAGRCLRRPLGSRRRLPPQASRYIPGSSPQAPKATFGSVPCARVLVSPLYYKPSVNTTALIPYMRDCSPP